jgi:arginyl-tRNA synthetase
MQFSGARVIRINYPSDIGLTVAKGVWGLLKTAGNPADISALGEAYRIGNEGYENDPSAKPEIDAINKKLYEDSDPALTKLRKVGIETSRRHLDAICERLGTKFDVEIFESEAGPIGRDIVLAHVGDVFEKSDGAIVYKGEQDGLHTRVFISSAGLPTYEAKDVGNFKLKTEKFPDWTRSFVVTGVEQLEYFKVVIAAIKKLFAGAEEKVIGHIPTGFLTLTTGKMSSRKGNVLTGESLLADLEESANARAAESRAPDKKELAQQVAVAAIKYQLLKQGSGKNMVFDKEKSLSLEGDSGPYLQYAHARTRAILEKAKEQNIEPRGEDSRLQDGLARLLRRFPEIVERAAAEYEPHLVTNYLLLIASEFNSWYAREQILDGTPDAAHKVALTAAAARTLKNGLWLLGIPAPEKM